MAAASKMRLIAFHVWFGVLLTWAQAQPMRSVDQGSGPDFGTIEGRVVSEVGKPVGGVRVYTEPINAKNRPGGKLYAVMTDDKGNFVLRKLTPGVHLICTVKREDLYPDTGAGALADDLAAIPRVRIEGGKIVRGITVRLRKGGRLWGQVLDAHTGQPVPISSIRLSRVDDPRLFISTAPDEMAHFKFVIPSKPFRVEVSASGYETWKSDGHGAAVLVAANSSKDLVIRLRRNSSMPDASRQLRKKLRAPEIRELISAIIAKTVQSGDGRTSEGLKVWTPLPPSDEAVSDVRGMGAAAIPILAEYLWRDDRENLAASRLLNSFGEVAAFSPFIEVAKKHPAASSRTRALRFLSQGPRGLSGPVLEWSALNDPEFSVRAAANEILISWKNGRK